MLKDIFSLSLRYFTNITILFRPQSTYWYDVMNIVPSLNITRELFAGEDRLTVCKMKGCFRIDCIPKHIAE